MQTQEDHSHQTQAVNSDSLKVDLVVKQNSCSEKEDSNSETASSKSAKECSLNSETQDVHANQLQDVKSKKKDAGHIAFSSFTPSNSTVQDDNSRLGNVTDADDADMRPIYDEEPMAEVQLTAECNIFAIGQQHTEQPKIINEGRVEPYFKATAVMIGSKQNLRANNQTSRSFALHSKSTRVTIMAVPSDSLRKYIPCYVQSPIRTRNSNSIPLDQRVILQKPGRHIFTGIGKLFDSCTSKVDSEPPHGSNVDIPNIQESKQTLDVSAEYINHVQKEQRSCLSAVDSQMMIQKDDVCSHQFKPQSSMSNDVCSQQFRPRSSMSKRLNKTVQASHHSVNRSSSSRL
ncbi:hypothetical protein Tco_1419180 [Tanacetum coccineum]